MTNRNPEISALSVVLRGSFNPQIFQPAWFASEKLLRQEESDAAKIQLIHSQVVLFDLEWLRLHVDYNRFLAATEKESEFDSLRDLVLGTFRILRHTPINQMGINLEMHFRMPSEEDWHTVGHRLAPKEPWAGILEKPGMLTVVMEGHRTDGFKGIIHVRVEPSLRVHPGVFISVNDHYEVKDSTNSHGSDEITDIFENSWRTSIERSKKIINSILEVK